MSACLAPCELVVLRRVLVVRLQDALVAANDKALGEGRDGLDALAVLRRRLERGAEHLILEEEEVARGGAHHLEEERGAGS